MTKNNTASDIVEKRTSSTNAIDFEVSLMDSALKRERLAVAIAVASSLMTVGFALTIYLILPLKSVVPYLVLTDPYTGTASLIRHSDPRGMAALASSEVLTKSNISHFVIARESYDWDLIARRDWVTVNAMGAPEVVNEFRSLFTKDSKSNPDYLYGKIKSVRVRIKSITLTPGASEMEGIAVVRFDKLVILKSENTIETLDSWTSNIKYKYEAQLSLSEEAAMENPVGFFISAYRVDREVSSTQGLLLKEVSAGALGLTPDRPRE